MAWCTSVQAESDVRERVHARGMAAESSCSKLEACSLGSLQELERPTHWTQCAEAAVWETCYWYAIIYTEKISGTVPHCNMCILTGAYEGKVCVTYIECNGNIEK